MDLSSEYTQELEPRLKKLAFVMLVFVGIILLRLYYLQGIRGKFYRLFSEENSIREIPIPALRGMMWDRNGVLLVDNRAVFDLILTPQYVVDPKKVFRTLEKDLHIPEEKILSKWAKRLEQPAYQPIAIVRDAPMDLVSWVKARKSPWGAISEDIDLRGVDIRLRYQREYLDGDIASHVLGYVKEIDAPRLKDYQQRWPGRYHLGDQIGMRGLEEVWDETVRGVDGTSQKVVNAVGREIVYPGMENELMDKEPEHGDPLKLTLDARLQRVARDFFKGKVGAVVALDPRDGAVLLMYSAPSFDLNRLGSEEGSEYWQQIANQPGGYLLNRALQGAYPPGSTYKIVTGTAALQEGVVKPEERISCGGALTLGNRSYHCWRKGGHGIVNFYRSLVASCDVFYYNMGLRLGVDRLAKYAHAFGLGQITGIDLPDERSGLIPTSEWKLKVRKEPWQDGETPTIAIGQGYDLVTPLQSAKMVSMVANGGKNIQPYLVKKPSKNQEGDVILSPEALKLVYQGLVGVVGNAEGTAHRLSALKIPMGGKTGTAQVVALGKSCAGTACLDHAWFVAFAPADHPTIAVSVLVEHGGHGSSGAAPLAGELIKTYLGTTDKRPGTSDQGPETKQEEE